MAFRLSLIVALVVAPLMAEAEGSIPRGDRTGGVAANATTGGQDVTGEDGPETGPGGDEGDGAGDAREDAADNGDEKGTGDKGQSDKGEGEEDTEKTEALPTGMTEDVVVSASATSDSVLDSPAAVDVLTSEKLQARPADHIADQLRRVPGINVVQFSARDVNISSRGATGGINNSTLALVDGRTLYQDFLGFIMWEFAPRDPSLVDRVEVVRGPASSLWGANAVGGLVHVITKSPRDTLGRRLTIESGNYGRRRLDLTESFLAGNWALRVAAGYNEGDPFLRADTLRNLLGVSIDPTFGLIPEDERRDSGTRQPKLDLRADWRSGSGSEWIIQGGWGRTRGWMATGLGPFDIDPGTSLSYAQVRYRKGSYEAQADFDYFDGDAKNLINAIPFGFTAGSSHYSVRGRTLLGQRGVLGWGTEGKQSRYDLSIAPGGERRTQAAAFAEVDLGLAPRLRLITGARADHVRETIGTVISPRAALQFKPRPNHTARIAWGHAFRSPTVIESDLHVPAIPVALLDWEQIDEEEVGFPFFSALAEFLCADRPDNCGAPPGEIPQYVAVTAARGSSGLTEERTESIEVGYAARFGRFGLQTSLYRTRSKDGITFSLMENYGFGPDGEPGTGDDIILPADPDGDGIEEAPAVDVCPLVDALSPFSEICPSRTVTYNHFLSIALNGLIPSLFQYENGAASENVGFEIGLDWTGPKGLFAYANYSWQDDPEIRGVPMLDIVNNFLDETSTGEDLDGDGFVAGTNDFVNIPAGHRVSVGVQVDQGRWFGALSWDYVDRTFWQDVLTVDFWGFVPKYNLVGLRGGARWPEAGLELTAQITNLMDDPIQQHVYGDIIDRRASVALTYRWQPREIGAAAAGN